MEYLGYFIVGVIALFIFIKLISWPLKIMWKLAVNGLLGFVILLIFNFIGNYIGINIGINIATILIAGFFGIPGVIFLVIFKIFL